MVSDVAEQDKKYIFLLANFAKKQKEKKYKS